MSPQIFMTESELSSEEFYHNVDEQLLKYERCLVIPIADVEKVLEIHLKNKVP